MKLYSPERGAQPRAGRALMMAAIVGLVVLTGMSVASLWSGAEVEGPAYTSVSTTAAVPAGSGAAMGTVYVGTVLNGVLRSIDGGTNYYPTALTGKKVNALAQDAGCTALGSSEVLFALIYDSSTDTGLYNTGDIGDTFPATAGQPMGAPYNTLVLNEASPANGTAGCGDLFVGTDDMGLYYSDDSGASFSGLSGGSLGSTVRILSIALEADGGGAGVDAVYVGTDSAGVHMADYSDLTAWTDVSGDLPVSEIHAFAVSPTTGTLFAGTTEGLHYSTDGGTTWTAATGDGIDGIDVDALGIVDIGGGEMIFAATGDGYNRVYVSADDGVTWTQDSGPIYDMVLSFHQSTGLADDYVFAAGLAAVYKQTDTDTEFSIAAEPLPVNAVVQALAFNAAGDRLYGGSFNFGVVLSVDPVGSTTEIGLDWIQINNGLDNALVYGLATYEDGGDEYVFAATWGDGIFRSDDAGESWTFSGLPETLAYDFAHCSSDNYLFTTYDDPLVGQGQIARSVDNGSVWLNIGSHNTSLWSLDIDEITDPDCNTLYAGSFGYGAFKSTDGGVSWDSTGLDTGYVFDFAIEDRSGDARIYAAMATGVTYSDDGGETWTDFSDGLGPVVDVRTIALVDDGSGTEPFLAIGTWGAGIWVYDWSLGMWLRDGLEDEMVSMIVVHPVSGQAYVTTDAGRVYQKKYTMPSIVTGVDDPEATLPGDFLLSQNYPNPFNPTTQIGFTLPAATDARLAVYDLLGREVAVLVDGALTAGTHVVTFAAGNLPSGTYLYRLETASETFARTMVLSK